MIARRSQGIFGAIGGGLAYCALFLIDVAGTPIDFMGFSADSRAKNIIFTRYGTHIVLEQVKILACYAALGALIGAIALWLAPVDGKKRALGRGALAGILVHAIALTLSLRHYPQLYSELLYDRGGLRKYLMVALASPRSSIVIIVLLSAALAFLLRQAAPRRLLALALIPLAFILASAAPSPKPASTALPSAMAASPTNPNVLFIAVDSLRADRIFAPNAAQRFPNLAQLAARSVRFRDAHVTVPRTFPSWTTLLTGRYPHHHGIRHMFPSAAERANIGPTLPSALASAGYRTAVVSDYAGEIFSRTPYGFQIADAPRFDMRTIVDQRSLQVHPNLFPYATTPLGLRLFPVVHILPERADPAILAARARGYLDTLAKDRFFLTVFFSTAHFPYASPAPYYSRFADPSYTGPFRFQKPPLSNIPITAADAKQIGALYDGAIAAVDAAVGTLLEDLRRSGRDRDTIIVLLADHGENLYDVPGRGMGHGDHLLGDAADHIPLLLFDPRTPVSLDIDAVVRDIDLAPTLAARLGVAFPSTDGVDLSPLIRKEKQLDLSAFTETEFWFTPTGPGFAADERLPYPDVTGVTDLDHDDDIYLKPEWRRTLIAAKHRSIRRGRYKLLYRPTRSGVSLLLYDVVADPRQLHDLSAERPEELESLKRALLAWIAQEPGASRAADFVLPGATPGTTIKPATDTSPSHSRSLLALAGQAELSGPPLSAAWDALRFPEKIISPYSGLRGEAAHRVVVPTFGAPWDKAAKHARTDLVWNRYRGTYRAERSLFFTTGTRYRFPLSDKFDGTFVAQFAVPRGAATSTFEIACNDRVVHQRTLDAAHEAERWLPLSIPLTCTGALSLSHSAPDTRAALFVGDPRLLATDDKPKTPNLLFLVVDTLRSDVISRMPRLSAWQAGATRFDQAITAATWTRPSLLAMFGGDLPTALGQSAEAMIPTDAARHRFYQVSPPLLPRLLSSAGYDSVAIGNNFFLLGHPRIGLDFGFQRVADIRHPELDTPAIADEAIAYLDHSRAPFFLYLHFDGPHWPYTAPAKYRVDKADLEGLPRDPDMARYLAEARYTDDHLARVFEALTRNHLDDSTVVVLVGDHGEIFDHAHDHRVEALGFSTLHHHGWSAYDEIARVPLLVKAPGISPRAVPDQVSLIDLAPTLHALLAQPARDTAIGRSLVPLMRGESLPARPAFVEGQNIRLLRQDHWAYLRRSDGRLVLPDHSRVTRIEELYDLSTDPAQHHDLAATRPEILAKLRADFDRAAPHLPAGALPAIHLRAGLALGARHLRGTITSPGLPGPRTVDLGAGTQLDLTLDPPDAPLTFALTVDGRPLSPHDFLVGEFAIPLWSHTDALTPSELSLLDTPRAAPDTPRDLLRLWRDPSNTTSGIGASTAESNDEVAGMMQRWGYAQPDP